MRRLVLAVIATLGLAIATSVGGSAGIDLTETTQATLSCNDGHSATLAVDPATLNSLASDVAAVNASLSGLSCGLSSASVDPSSQSSDWTVYDYNPSDRAIAPRHSPNSGPATTTGATTTFPFFAGTYTALLTTTDDALTGDLSSRTLNDTVHVSGGAATFLSQNGDGCNAPANVRFYFTSPSASGSSVGSPPAGFYTKFWWSNPVNVPLVTGNQADVTISNPMSDPSLWSDWNGQNGAEPAVLEAFIEATHKVQSVGLSFGGGCFFENGVTTSNDPESFSSTFTES